VRRRDAGFRAKRQQQLTADRVPVDWRSSVVLRSERSPSSRYGIDMTVRTFNAVFEDAGDGWVYAHVPELPEVQTQGEVVEIAA
jgi:hypothetical protein